MSINIVGLAFSAAEIALLQYSAPGAVGRQLGSLTAAVTISEKHEDDVEITEHPVEVGAQISDHAYVLPSIVTLTVGWSASPASASLTDLKGKLFGATPSTLSQPKEVYAKLLDMRAKLELLTVVTGKRTYKNMMIRSLQVTTDKDTENVLVVVARLQQIFFVATQTAILPAATQKQPEATAAILATGKQQLTTPPTARSSIWPPFK